MTTREQASQLVRELVEAVNAHDVARLVGFYAENAVTVSPVSGHLTGLAAIRGWWQEVFALFPDWAATMSDVLVDGNRVVFFGTAAATDKNGWFGQPPTGERFEYRAIIQLTLVNGKIVRDERIYDLSSVVQRFEKTRLDKEMKLAAEVQRALVSGTRRSTNFCEVAADSVPCRAIGGDFLASAQLPSGDVAVVLGDVAGKGPPSGLLASMLQGMLAVQLQAETNLTANLETLNRLLVSKSLEPRFATLTCGVLHPSGCFRFSNAGHMPAIVLSRNGVRRLTSGGPVLGVLRDARFEEEITQLDDQDIVIMFSDGVIEARNAEDKEFGEDRLISCVQELSGKRAGEMVKGVLAGVRQFCNDAPQTDDITVMVTQFQKNM